MGLAVVFDIAAVFWRELVAIAVISAAVVLGQASVVTLVMASVGAAPPLPEVAGQALAALRQESPRLLPLLILAMGLLSAGAVFFVRRLSVGLMIRYETLCARRVIGRLREDPAVLAQLNDSNVLTLLSKDCRFGGRIAFELTSAVFPLSVALIAVPMLLYINLTATLSLLLVMLLAAMAQLLLRPAVHRLSHGMEAHGTLDKRSKAAALKLIRARKGGDVKTLLADVPNPVFMETYRRRLLMPHIGNMIGAVQVTLALSVTVISFSAAPANGAPLSNLVLFLAIALFVLSQLQSVSKIFVNFHIFNTYFRRAFLLMRGQGLPVPASAPGKSPDPVDELEPDDG